MAFEIEKKEEKKGFLQSYRDKRLLNADTNLISDRQYNLTIGFAILGGLLINLFMAYFLKEQILSIPIIAVIIAYFIMSLGGIFVVHKASSAFVSGIGYIVLVVGMGLLLTFFLSMYAESSVYLAFGITAGITLAMIALGTLFPAIFLSMGKMLGISLIITIVAEIFCAFFFRQALVVFDYIVIAIFSLFIGFDWARAQQYPKTMNNAIDSAADLYVDIINILIRVLEITGKANS